MICCPHEKQKKTKKSGFPECLGTWHSGKAILKKRAGASPSACAFGTRGRLFKKTKGASPSACAWALGEEVFKKKIEFLPRVLHSGKRFQNKKRNFFPKCCTRGRVKKRETAPTVLNRPRGGGWHSGKASPSVRFLALGEGLFPVRGIPGGSSPSVALGEGFPECFGTFPECIWHSGKQLSPVVIGV
jgi:hypothetical protein